MHKHRSLRLEELCDFVNGNGFKPEQWKSHGLPIIRIQNLNGSTDFNYYDGPVRDRWIVEPGVILFAWAGVKGVSFGPCIWPGPKGVLNQHIFRVEPREEVDVYWLYGALELVTARIEAKAHGFKASLLHVQRSEITKQIVDVPTLDEQRRIGQILRSWEQAIEKTERLIAAKEERLKANILALFRQNEARYHTFGDFLSESQLPGSNGARARKLTVKLYGKGVVAKSGRQEGSSDTKYFVRRSGHLIYSKLDFLNGAFGIVPIELDGHESTLDLPAFDVSPAINPIWLLEYLRRPDYYTRQASLARGQRIARRVNPAEFLASDLRVPSRKHQDLVAAALTEMRAELELTVRQRDALIRQKRGLMQKLLTGGWSVTAPKSKEAAE